MAADASIQFDISLDLGKIKTAIDSTSHKVKADFEKTFLNSAKKCQQSCDEMAGAFGKINTSTDETRQKIEAVLNNSEKSAKSKASSIAWIYRKQGMTQSEAMRKAWTEIERNSKVSSRRVKKSIWGIGAQAQETSRELTGTLGPALKKVGLTLAAAFSVKKLVDFGARCIELGSDLQEVQNVVDVTFPRMSKQVDTFAQGAAASFGLSETMAKKFTGTFGAMAKAFGFNEKAAYEMSTALTGLAGDVASFYNISQDEAYTKLKSVFTGETESLKDLGVVMTQSALDSYALANGFGKTTKAMSEGEKVALRYKFVQDQLALASGDFIRTSDGWANQVRVLKLQFDSLKATIGQGLINVLTPVIKVINTIIGKLMSLANAFRAFTEALFGNAGGGSGATAMSDAMNNAASASGVAAGNAKKLAGASEKAKKNMGSTGIDELNIISGPVSSGEAGENATGGVGGIPGLLPENMAVPPIDTSAVEAAAQRIKDSVNRLRQFLSDNKNAILSIAGGLASGILSYFAITRWDAIKNAIVGTFGTLKTGIMAAVSGLSLPAAGAAAAIGLIVAGIIDLWNTSYQFRDAVKLAWELIANAFRTSWSFIWNEGLKPLGEALAELGSTLYTFYEASGLKRLFEIVMTALVTVAGALTSILIGAISGALTVILKAVTALIHAVTWIVEKILWLKDNWVEVWRGIADFFSRTGQAICDTGRQMMRRIAESISSKLDTIQAAWNRIWENIHTFAGNIWDSISSLAVTIFTTIRNELSDIWSAIRGTVETVWNGIRSFFTSTWTGIKTTVSTITDGIYMKIQTVMSAVKNQWTLIWNAIHAFTDTLWNAIKNLAEAVFTAIQSKISAVWAVIRNTTETIWNGIRSFFTSTWTGIKDTVSSLADGIRDKIQMVMDAVKSGIQTALDSIREKWSSVWNGLKETTISVFDGMKDGIRGGINGILKGVETMANGVIKGLNRMIDALNNLSFDIPDWVPGLGGESFGLDIPTLREIQIPRLAKGGFVRANTPQLAMIGDNRHYGEIVAPEDRMQEMVNRAALMASQANSGMSDQYLALMVELLKQIIELIEAMDLTVNIDIREIKKKLTDLDKRTGFRLRTT